MLFQVCFISYLLDDGKESAAPPPAAGLPPPISSWAGSPPTHPKSCAGVAADDEHWQGLRWYLLATWIPLLLVLGTVSLFYSAVPDAPCWPLRLGLLGSVGLTALFLQLFQFLRGRMRGGATPTPNVRREIALHTVVALLFGVVLVPAWPHFPTLLWCFLAGCWAAAHGGLLALYHVPRKPGQAWKHFLAGALFGTFFVIYQFLFLAYCLSLWFPAAADWFSPPPALVVCALLALLVNVHGFLRFNYRGRHYFAAVALVALIGWTCSVLCSDPYPLRLAHLADYYASPVRLGEADYQAVLVDAVQKDKEGGPSVDVLRPPFDQLAGDGISARGRRDDALAPADDETPATSQCGAAVDRLRTNLLAREDRRLEAWRKRLMKGDEPPKLAVVAVSGGAARAAFWTAHVLDELEQADELRPFPAHVRLITGASGGMVGAAHWAATLDEGGHTDATAYSPDDLARDNLTPVADALLFADLPTWPSGHVRDTDRGRALEAAWRRLLSRIRPGLPRPAGAGRGRGLAAVADLFADAGRGRPAPGSISNLYLPFLTENAGETLSTSREGGRPRSRVPPDDDPTTESGRYRYSVQRWNSSICSRRPTTSASARPRASVRHSPTSAPPPNCRRSRAGASWTPAITTTTASIWRPTGSATTAAGSRRRPPAWC